ncbi:MAG TPA: PhoH family protein [Firmicutes bacterium]|nr:PhoH family protein [Bacillota bacterium]
MAKPSSARFLEDTDTSSVVSTAIFEIGSAREAQELFGKQDEIVRLLENAFDVSIIARDGGVVISGGRRGTDMALRVLEDLRAVVRSGGSISARDAKYAISLAKDGDPSSLHELLSDVVQVTVRGRQIRPKTLGQKRYIDAMRRSSLVFAIGPAGTGKTYLAMAVAIGYLKAKEVSRIVLTRPAVEAGEKLGFLPGDLQEKVNPYLRPLYDAIFDILGVDVFQKYMERGIIEVAPLAYMRGRTLDDSFIILDEAQNTTHEQMKMFLTRLGFSSRAVVTGDLTQIDLPKGQYSGLAEVQAILKGTEGIEFVYLTDQDVIRHELVQRIVRAYERFERSRALTEEGSH